MHTEMWHRLFCYISGPICFQYGGMLSKIKYTHVHYESVLRDIRVKRATGKLSTTH